MWINLHTFAQLYIFANVCKSTNISIFWHCNTLANIRWLLYSLFCRIHSFGNECKQLTHCCTRILDTDDSSRSITFKRYRCSHKYHTRLCSRKVMDVLSVTQKSELTFFGTLNRTNIGDFAISIARNFTPKEKRYLLSRKFHINFSV